MYFKNDIHSSLRLSADDCLLYKVINCKDDAIKFQEDLNKLSVEQKICGNSNVM